MKITKTAYASNRTKWRSWLEQHHATETEVWLVYYKKGCGKPSATYLESLEEALCFGWIDSVMEKFL